MSPRTASHQAVGHGQPGQVPARLPGQRGSSGLVVVARLTWMTTRNGPRSTVALPVIAFGLTTALLLIVLAGALHFFRWRDELGFLYQSLAGIATVLLVVPLLTLGGSAARLCARRHDEQLSTLRLLGATPVIVGAVAVLEAIVLALLGALLGVVAYISAVPLVGLIPFRGEQISAAGLLLHPLLVLGVVIAVGLIALLSAVLGLRRVTISPLGVRTRQQPSGVSWLRLVFGAGAVVAAYAAISSATNAAVVIGAATLVLVVVAGFGLTLAVLNLIGPALLSWIARRSVYRAQDPVRLLSARQILKSPKSAWRQVSGVAMTSFVAVFAGVSMSFLDEAALEGSSIEDITLFTDIRTGVLITLTISFLMVACSVGVNQAAQILDRSELLVSLDRMGMPRGTMEAARRRAVLMPIFAVCLGSALTAAVVLFPLSIASLLLKPLTVAIVIGCLAAGIGLVWLSLRATGAVTDAVLRGHTH